LQFSNTILLFWRGLPDVPPTKSKERTMTNRSVQLKQQIAYRQVLALSVMGGAMALLFGALVMLLYFN
jgi:hypothetical protein